MRGRHELHAIVTNDVSLIAAALWEDADRLRGAANDASGWGLGTIQDRRAIVKRRPMRHAHVFDFPKMATDAPSRVVIGVSVGPMDAPVETDAIPPFRHHGWLLGCTPLAPGALSRDARKPLRAALPDHVRRAMDGDSDAELLCATVHAGIASQPTAATPDFPAERAAELVREGVANASAALGALFEVVVSNGRAFVAAAGPSGLSYRWICGLDDDPVEREARRGMRLAPRPTPRPHFRALVVSTTERSEEGWQRLDAGAMLSFDPSRAPVIA